MREDPIRDAIKSVDPLVAARSQGEPVDSFQADLSFLSPQGADENLVASPVGNPLESPVEFRDRAGEFDDRTGEFHDRPGEFHDQPGAKSDQVIDLQARRKRRKWQVLAAVAATALIVAGIVFAVRFSLPGVLPAQVPDTPTTPSVSSSPAQNDVPSSDAELVTPGLSSVESAPNAASCDLTGVITAFAEERVPNGNLLLGQNPWLGTVIGCSEEWALVYPTEAYFYAMGRPAGLNGQLLFFQRVDDAWTTSPDLILNRYFPGAGTVDYIDYMDAEFAWRGIPAELREPFVGNEWGPATFMADGPGAGADNQVTTVDGAFTIPLPPGWSLQEQEAAPSGAVLNSEGNTRLLLGQNAQLGGACAPSDPGVTYETLYSAPITLSGGFDSTSPANARIVVRAFTEGTYRVAIGIDRLETDQDSGQSCQFFVNATDLKGTSIIAASAYQVLATPAEGGPNTGTVLEFENRESVQSYLRSTEFDDLLFMMTMLLIQ